MKNQKKLESVKNEEFSAKLTASVFGGNSLGTLTKTSTSVWTSWPSCYDKCAGDLKTND